MLNTMEHREPPAFSDQDHPYAIHALPGLKQKIIRFNDMIPPSVSTLLSVGFSRSGKTHCCIQMYSNKNFPYRSMFGNGERIWLISPTHHVQAEWEMLNIPDTQKHSGYSEQVLREVIRLAENDTNEPKLPRLIIIDDCVSTLPMSRQSALMDLLVYGRHLSISAMCMIQKFSCSLSHVSKVNFTGFLLYP